MKLRFSKCIVAILIMAIIGGMFNNTVVYADSIEQEELKASEESTENCHTMTNEWFGSEVETFSLSEEQEVSNTNSVLSEYFAAREQDYAGISLLSVTNEYSVQNEEVKAGMQQREIGIAEFQENAEIMITDAEITTLYGEDDIVINEDGTITVFVYEWTFFDYDDLSDEQEITDVSGYGTYHKITLEEIDGQYEIIADEYDESDILGICTMNETTEAELLEMNYEPYDIDSEIRATMISTYAMYDGYNPDAAANYADQYVYTGATSGSYNYEGYYNSAYYNFNSLGGDCANYTSQCINAGGMPQVVGSKYGNDGWYYKSSSDRSATWTGAANLETWMGNNRGNRVTASDSTVYKGSPVFYNSAHATICVGKNSAGVPIINSHNYDKYHVKWNYWGSGTTYTTVQLTDGTGNKIPVENSGSAPKITDVSVSDVSASGYTVTCTVDAENGLDCVRFPTWTENNGQDDLNSAWTTSDASKGTINGNRVTFRVNASEHNGESGLYHTHIYAYDRAGKSSCVYVGASVNGKALTPQKTTYYNKNKYEVYPVNMNLDSWTFFKTYAESVGGHLVTITSEDEQKAVEAMLDSSVSGYYIGATDEKTEGTWKWVSGENWSYTNWSTGQPDNYAGAEHYMIYQGSNINKWNDVPINNPTQGYSFIIEYENADIVAPTIMNVRLTDVSSEGYTVNLTVWDAIKLDKVLFSTWTPDKDDDDLVEEWKTIDAENGPEVITYQVKVSEHDNETGRYATHVYVYDEAGNCSDVICNASIGEKVYEPVAKVVYGGHTYELYDTTFGHWTTAKTYCDSINGYLACITSAGEQAAISELLKKGSRSGYWAGGTDQYVEGEWTWVTSENMTYMNWKSGEPNDTEGNSDYMVIEQSGEWTDHIEAKVEANDVSVYGFICELPYEEHLHSYVGSMTKEATCQETGLKTYTCSCGDTYTETIKATGHNYSNGSCTKCGSADPDYETDVDINSPQIIVESKTASSGDSVDVTIALKNNPGVASMKLKVSFDSLLTLENVSYNSSIGGQSQQPQNMTSPVTLNWYNGSADSEGDWTFATLTFKVSEDAEADTTANITVTYNADDVYDISETNIDFAVQNGAIIIADYLPGDINGDGYVNNKDLTRLFQYLSDWDVEVVQAALDVNGDGSINNKDQTRLFQYLSDWDVVIY
ncbi:MAG: GBS Bsp-like repeat-containing protein [Lachnospiraceae bacterium]|nr:GBS Bsp-like repeat-containing protein [Lachnospiraceae bacterium]